MRVPIYAGVCQECGSPTGNAGSWCDRCWDESRRAREAPKATASTDGPFLPEDDEITQKDGGAL